MLSQEQPKFNSVLVQAVHEGLDSIGPSLSDAVLFHLQWTNAIRSSPSLIDPEAFDDGLKRLFGYGARVIERRILELLYEKLEAPREIKVDFKFSEEVEKAQKLLGSMGILITKNPQ